MRAYTSKLLVACWIWNALGCSNDLDKQPPLNPATLYDERQDAGATNCELQGTWEISLSTADTCSPMESGAVIRLTVDSNGADSEDFASAELPPLSPCGQYKHEVGIAANGCTITASSLATWCSEDRPQCSDYQLTLHVREDGQADVEGDYRRCWCGSPSSFGTKVEVAGSAVRR